MNVATLRSFDIAGPAGKLEALLNVGGADAAGKMAARYSCLVCHPHPLGGGTMHNKVVYHAMKALHGLGFPVLRFNFRGVGLSAGAHDEGHGEKDDVRACLDWLDREFSLPILLCGFSFGSAVGMRVGCADARVPGLIALGLPVAHDTRRYQYPWLASCAKPKLFISGDHDQYGPRAELEQIVAAAGEPHELIWIADADHFFMSGGGGKGGGGNQLQLMQAAITAWVKSNFPDEA